MVPTPSAHPGLDSSAVPTPSEDFPYKEQIDPHGNYFLFWDRNGTHVTMEVHVRTHGYVGFGLSPNGNMFPADIVIGWVKDGQTFFKDRHSVGHSEPLIDQSQDWMLLHGEESDFGTILKFTRKINTCDPDDIEISESTMRVIYSYHQDDPVGEHVAYHGAKNRGARSIMFLSKTEEVQFPSDAVAVEFTNNKFPVPSNDTTYQCTVFDLKWLNGKHHLIHFEPVVQPGHEELVHHIIVYKCPMDRKYINLTYECDDPKYSYLHLCPVVYLAWAVGGEAYYFPENIGLPVNEDDDDDLYIMQLHYNNHHLRSDYVDSSGLRITVTNHLRPIEAGEFASGVLVSPLFQVVPPHEQTFTSTGVCPAECIREGLGGDDKEIHIISIFQHAHLLARGIKTRLIRNGVEQKPLADDNTYDFNFQDIRRINRTLKSGDSIIVECTYNSTGRSVPTYGGDSTHEEMCLTFFYYYPRMKLAYCESGPAYDNVPVPRSHIMDFFKTNDWSSPQKRAEFKDIVRKSKHVMKCGGDIKKALYVRHIEYPNTTYVEPPKCLHRT